VAALSYGLDSLSPIRPAGSAQKDECSFLILGTRAKNIAGQQAADKKTHPFPAGFLARHMEKFSRLLRGQA
jgi:hypothetical protein